MKELHEIHKQTYDSLASEYNQKWKGYLEHQRSVLLPFVDLIKDKFDEEVCVLDVGCGVGLDLFILNENGIEVVGIDLSSEMAKYAQNNVPDAKVLVGNFLEYNFDKQYQGIVMDVFVHLFPSEVVSEIFGKLKKLVVPGGYVFISTTLHDDAKEGWYEKEDYLGGQKRYRRYYTKKDFLELFDVFGVKIIKVYEDSNEVSDKHFINTIIQFEEKN